MEEKCERGMDMRYNAMEVARYIITRCSEKGRAISNLKLQKMLYFLWVDFYKKTNRKLFLDDICAWQLGQVVPEVYYEYCSYGGRPIFAEYTSKIKNNDQRILDDLIDDYIDVPASVLVSKTHKKGSAWDKIYKDGFGNRRVIPFSLIIEKEVG